nr:NADH dehydrogenase subunit 2 [Tartessus sp.]
MFKNSSMMMFLWLMVTGMTISMSSNNWMMIWSGMEVSLMAFMPMMTDKNKISSESSIKYFIIQSISSSLLISGIMMMLMNYVSNNQIILTSLMMKIGMAPFHVWVLTVLEGLSYMNVFIMISLIKIPPLYIMSLISTPNKLMIFSTLILGSISSINQNSLRKIIGFSSIFNMGMVVICIKYSMLWMMFMFIYSIINFILILILHFNKMNYVNQMCMKSSMIMKLSAWICILSMGGVPPLLGFFMKLIIIEKLILMNEYMTMFILVLFSTVMMFTYMRMMFLSMMIFSLNMKWFKSVSMLMYKMTISLNLILPMILIYMKMFL